MPVKSGTIRLHFTFTSPDAIDEKELKEVLACLTTGIGLGNNGSLRASDPDGTCLEISELTTNDVVFDSERN
jgi:hypothetical protein